MATTSIAPSTTAATSTATSSTPDVTPLTTTFTPPARCTEYSSYGFTMLSSPGYEIWVNEPVPVSSSTVSTCYPSEFLDAYSTTKLVWSSSTYGSSVVAAMSPFVCPQSWETVLTAPGNYVACCPPSFTRADPKTTVDGYRPMYGGTCYSDVPYLSVLSHVTQYNNRSIIATVPITATTSGMQVYAHPMDGYALQQQTIYLSDNSSVPSTTATASPSLQSETVHRDHGLSGGAIAGIVIGSIAGLLVLLSLLWFALRRRRRSLNAQKRVAELSDEAKVGTSLEKSGFVESAASPVHEKEGDNKLATELSGESMPELESARLPVELDGNNETSYFPRDEKR